MGCFAFQGARWPFVISCVASGQNQTISSCKERENRVLVARCPSTPHSGVSPAREISELITWSKSLASCSWQNHFWQQESIPETELAASISRYLKDPSGPHQSGARCTPRHLICTADNRCVRPRAVQASIHKIDYAPVARRYVSAHVNGPYSPAMRLFAGSKWHLHADRRFVRNRPNNFDCAL